MNRRKLQHHTIAFDDLGRHDPELYVQIRVVAFRLGMRIERRPLGYSWDGRALSTSGMSVSGVLHEAAHFMLSSPERRRLREFGLGSPPLGFGLFAAPREVPKVAADAEEELAQVLGCALEANLGLRFEDTVDRSLAIRDGATMWRRAVELDYRGLLRQARVCCGAVGPQSPLPVVVKLEP